jgi:hypothetical protein
VRQRPISSCRAANDSLSLRTPSLSPEKTLRGAAEDVLADPTASLLGNESCDFPDARDTGAGFFFKPFAGKNSLDRLS